MRFTKVILSLTQARSLGLGIAVLLMGHGVASAQSQYNPSGAQAPSPSPGFAFPAAVPSHNDPAIVRPSGYSVQQPAPTSNGSQQITVLPNGQRVFGSPGSEQTVAPELAMNSHSVQQANYVSNAVVPSHERTKPKASIELKPRSKDTAGSVDKPTSTWAAGLSMFFSLTIVLSLFLVIAWLFRKSQPGAFARLPGDVVQVLGRTAMAPRQQVYVVRFGGKLLLVSHQPGQTQTLGEITDPDEVQRLAGICEANQPNSVSHSFRDILKQVASGKSEPETRNYRKRSAL